MLPMELINILQGEEILNYLNWLGIESPMWEILHFICMLVSFCLLAILFKETKTAIATILFKKLSSNVI